jgi:phosphoglycolate phosphatase-like HAD superfamily hydrolase
VTVLLWDIDGTLLSTARAGVYALEFAAREVCGEEIDLQVMKTAGLTDSEIAAAVIEAHRHEPAPPEDVERFLEVYGRELPAALPRREGEVFPNVREILASVDARHLLLTGNIEAGARAKLTHYGLIDHFEGGAFCRPGDDRPTIARRAAEIAGVAPEEMLVIGDTPHDVHCATAIGVRTLAVATGGYTAAELRETEAWVVVEQLPAPAEFAALALGAS